MSVSIAIIGGGFMGETHADALYKGDLPARVSYVVTRHQESAQALADKIDDEVVATTDLKDVLRDPSVDAIDICTPTPTHLDLVTQAAEAGKHILCEKPIALSLEDAEAMIEVCRKHGVQFMVAHTLRFWPEYVEAARLFQSGRLGRLRHIWCCRLSTGPKWVKEGERNWFLDLEQSGGAVIDLAIHDFDFVNWIGGMPLAVEAMGSMRHFDTTMELADGATAHVEASNCMPDGWEFRMAFRIVGEEGIVEFDGSGGTLTLIENDELTTVEVEGSRTFKQNVADEEALDGYHYELRYFVECLERGEAPEIGRPEDGKKALDIALQVREALG